MGMRGRGLGGLGVGRAKSNTISPSNATSKLGPPVPRVEDLRVTAKKPCDKDDVQRAVKRRISSLLYCYKRYVRRNPDMQGALAFTMNIDDRGRSKDIVMTKNKLGTGGEQVETCSRRRLTRLRFPRAPRSKTCKVKISYKLGMSKPKKEAEARLRLLRKTRKPTVQDHASILSLLIALSREKEARAWLARLQKRSPEMITLALFSVDEVRALFPKLYRETLRARFSRPPTPSSDQQRALIRAFREEPKVLASLLTTLTFSRYEAQNVFRGIAREEEVFDVVWRVWSQGQNADSRLRVLRSLPKVKHINLARREALALRVNEPNATAKHRQELILLSAQLQHPDALSMLDSQCGTGLHDGRWCTDTLKHLKLPQESERAKLKAWRTPRLAWLDRERQAHPEHVSHYLESHFLLQQQGDTKLASLVLSELVELNRDSTDAWLQYRKALESDPAATCHQILSFLQLYPRTYRLLSTLETLRREHPSIPLMPCLEQAASIIGSRFDEVLLITWDEKRSYVRTSRVLGATKLYSKVQRAHMYGLVADDPSLKIKLIQGKVATGTVTVIRDPESARPTITRKPFKLTLDEPSLKIP